VGFLVLSVCPFHAHIKSTKKKFNISGEYCEVKVDQPCPSSWWGYPVCGPCHCDVEKGYNADCNKTTGECYCKVVLAGLCCCGD
jgi:hypothetical protein